MPVRPFDPIGSSPYGKYLLCQYLSEFINDKKGKLETNSTEFNDNLIVNPDKLMLEMFESLSKKHECPFRKEGATIE